MSRPLYLHVASMLRKLHQDMVDDGEGRREKKTSKRQRIARLFQWKKLKPQSQIKGRVCLPHSRLPLIPLRISLFHS